MALINVSYFNGEINIPNTDKEAVADLLTQFIDKYEPELLRKVLGYGFYKDFMIGLEGAPIAQKWVDLLMGKDYTDQQGRARRWRGVVEGFTNVIEVLESLGSTVIQVGRGNPYDPVSGDASVTIPLSIQGKPFKFYQRAFGELDDTGEQPEYTISEDGTTLTLTQWTFSGSDKYFYHVASLTTDNSTVDTPRYSFIANYVYYWYVRNNATVTTDGGEKISIAENSDRGNPSVKITRAYNEAIYWIEEMYWYLDSYRETYDTWNRALTNCLRRINQFSI